MFIDRYQTEFRSGRIIPAKDFLFRRMPAWWEPQGDRAHYKIVARDIGWRILWQGNFADLATAIAFWQSLHELGPAPHQWDLPTPSWHPGLIIPGITYQFATVQSFTAVGTTTFTVPAFTFATDYLVIAGGGGGGSTGGGGGGAGGFQTATNLAVTPGAGLTVTIGDGGTSLVSGNNSVFSSITSTGGGHGSQADVNGVAGGSGGGAGICVSIGFGAGGNGTAGQGNNGGGNSQVGGNRTSGGGGGKSAVGATGTATNSGNGGNGTASSISGASVTYAGGGGGGSDSVGGFVAGSGGTGGGGNGATGAVNGTAGGTNTGGGGGGGGNVNGGGAGSGGKGGSGIVILSYTPAIFIDLMPSMAQQPIQFLKNQMVGY